MPVMCFNNLFEKDTAMFVNLCNLFAGPPRNQHKEDDQTAELNVNEWLLMASSLCCERCAVSAAAIVSACKQIVMA